MLRIMQQAPLMVRNPVAQMLRQNIDKDWFLAKLEENHRSVRGLARHMEIDPSAASRMLSGERRMKMDEASSIAQFLGVTVKEVLSHAGVAIDLDGQPTRILLAAIVNEQNKVVRLKEPRPLPQSVIDRAQAAVAGMGNCKIIAAQVRALTGPMAFCDDMVLLFKHTDTFDPAAIGTVSVVRLVSGEMHVARVMTARKTGEATLLSNTGKPYEAEIVTATPVIAMLP